MCGDPSDIFLDDRESRGEITPHTYSTLESVFILLMAWVLCSVGSLRSKHHTLKWQVIIFNTSMELKIITIYSNEKIEEGRSHFPYIFAVTAR